ncbi:MAG TPA: putative molybdenum carrier protein [Burkholderiales bacterium]|nr:putative molybdenum carrier protein [Burkholderiales bacterium]
MKNPVHALRHYLEKTTRPYRARGRSGRARAHIQFIGMFEGHEVVWDAKIYALRAPRAVAARPFIDISSRGSHIIGIKVGLAVEQLDVATLLKAMIMVRRYKRLRRGRFEFGALIPRPASKHGAIGKILSGGQTGVDRAALDVAIELGLARGGWCPKGRRAEDGAIASHYPLQETASTDYRERTRRNVRHADGTLIVTADELRGGTALTRALAEKLRKPCLVVDPTQRTSVRQARAWITTHGIHILNVAGPLESGQPGIYLRTRNFLRRLLHADDYGD